MAKKIEIPPSTEVLRDRARYEVRTPSRVFRGERAGVRFNDGVGHTDDAKGARVCADLGYAVLDREAEGPAFDAAWPDWAYEAFGVPKPAAVPDAPEKK